ncbi:MGDG synthase family glycosyltransferase [Dendronalium sp. ChiSLP03b]|uniref:MGDG synthase family glycosyltransferase n=1 Tax=Dendronalium sp. ChiSLP03b TaxID=3075381 RepID=UPI002AD4ACBE|nr:glycosyltransferase [Dendronalium sp. ChiSLP03b]MDZ8203894.1 glycosyltransferase [Dendronalium sp. ChiSLP03b]
MRSPSYLKKKILINIIVGKGGGGHYATYNALRSIIERQKLPWHLNVTDIDEIADSLSERKKTANAYKLLGFSGHELYNLMLKSGWTWIWPLKMRLSQLLLRLNYDLGVRFFENYWREQQPDLVISLVTMCNKGLGESLQRVQPGTPLVTIMIDFADFPPAFWIEPKTDNYVVCGTEKAVEQARDLGVKPERIIKTSGMVIHPRFYEPMCSDRRIERQRLGLDPDCPTGIVLFGGHGSKVMLEIAKRLECFQQKLQLIFLCGRNQELALALRENPGMQKRFVTTFTEDIPYYMHLADFFIGKPGPGSISEALVMKLPVIVERNFATLIHERYNTDWIQQQEVGLVIPSFRNIAVAVEQFLQPENFARYRANVAAVDNRAVFEIPDILQKILATSYKTTVAEALEPRL